MDASSAAWTKYDLRSSAWQPYPASCIYSGRGRALWSATMVDAIAISPEGRSRAIKRNGGYLGYAETQSQALVIAENLAAWFKEQGRWLDLLVRDTPSSSASRAVQGLKSSLDGDSEGRTRPLPLRG